MILNSKKEIKYNIMGVVFVISQKELIKNKYYYCLIFIVAIIFYKLKLIFIYYMYKYFYK